MSTRPHWVASLVAAEAARPRLFPGEEALADAVCSAVLSCDTPHGEQGAAWGDLTSMLDSAHAALQLAVTQAAESAEFEQDASLSKVQEEVERVQRVVSGCQVLAARGVHTTTGQLANLNQQQAMGLVQQVLGKASRSGINWSDKEWSALWIDLRDLHARVMEPVVPAVDVMAQYVTALLQGGRYSLAKSYLQGTGTQCVLFHVSCF